jgi:hypothetical protein
LKLLAVLPPDIVKSAPSRSNPNPMLPMRAA